MAASILIIVIDSVSFSLINSDIIHHVRLLHHIFPILSRRPELPPKKKPHEYFSNPNHYHQWP